MDCSACNPSAARALNLAARYNNVVTVKKLLSKTNPNCVDKRGWTCLHEAASNDSYESLLLILKHEHTEPLLTTSNGYTALHLACQEGSSLRTVKALLDSAPESVHTKNTENDTPLHVSAAVGRCVIIQLLLDYGAIVNVQNVDGETPLHEAALAGCYKTVTLLLHAGADPEIENSGGYSALHLACCQRSYQTVRCMIMFYSSVNDVTENEDSPLILATNLCNVNVIQFLLKNGADPYIQNDCGDIALTIALKMGHVSSFNILLNVTNLTLIDQNVLMQTCKSHNFFPEILESLLTYDLDVELFNFYENFNFTLKTVGEFKYHYLTSGPLNCFLKLCESNLKMTPIKFYEFLFLFLMRGVSVNAHDTKECPPLVYIQYRTRGLCFQHVFQILQQHGCDVDYCSVVPRSEHERIVPDAFLASMTSDPSTILIMLPYSLQCDAEYILKFATQYGFLENFPLYVKLLLMAMIDRNYVISAEKLSYTVLPLKHLCRQIIRQICRYKKLKHCEFIQFIDGIHYIPKTVKQYLYYRYRINY